MRLLKTLKMLLSDTYYDSIENLPMWNYNKIMQTGDLRHLIKKKRFFRVDLNPIWENILQEDMDFVGVNENVKQIIKRKKELALKICKYLENHKTILLNEINILENQIASLEKNNKESEQINFAIVCGHLSKYFGYKIDEKNTTLKEYRSCCKVIEEEQKQIEKLNLKNNG